VHPTLPSRPDRGTATGPGDELVGERIEALAGWLQELDAQLRSVAVSSDEKTLRELRGALEAWSKRDPRFEERLTERVDVLADRLTTLSSAVNTTAAAHAGADGELANLRRELEQESAKLHAALQKRVQGSVADAETIAELRRAVAELSAEKPGKRGEKTITDLRARIDYVGERVDTLAKTVATTAAGLAGREGDVVALRRSLEQASAQIGELETSVGEIASASDIADVGDQLRTLDGRLQKRLGSVEGKVEAASAGLSTKEHELVAVQGRLEEIEGRLESATRELREAIPSDTPTLADVEELIAPLHEQVEQLAGDLRARLCAVEATVATTSTDLSSQEQELATLGPRLEEVESRIESAARELREAIPSDAPTLADVEELIAPLHEQLEQLAGGLLESETKLGERLERESSRAAGVERRLDEADRRVTELGDTETELAAAVREAQAALAALGDAPPDDLDARLEPISAELGALARRLVEAERHTAERLSREESETAEVESLRGSLEPRLDALEEGRESAVAEAAARAAAAWSEEQAWVREHLDALVQAVAETPTKTDVEEPLATVSAKLDELESGRAALAKEIARAEEATTAEQKALELRIAELAERDAPVPPAQDKELKQLLLTFADRIEAMERERAAAEEAARAEENQIAGLRASLAALEARLESTEKLVADEDSNDVEERLETLVARLDSLDQTVGASRAAPLAPGDGRLRVDLRALELRMQHAEAAARESQEAVLLQLERLAARLEPDTIGEVVPIRGGADT